MPLYYGKQSSSSDRESDRYVCVNNCGYFEDLTDMQVERPSGRVDYQLIYIKSGAMRFFGTEGELRLGEGTVFLYRPGVPQRYCVDREATSFFWIHFTGREIASMLSFFTKDHYRIGAFAEFERYCRSFYVDFKVANRYSDLLYEGRLITLLARLAWRVENDPDRVREYSRVSEALLVMSQTVSERLDNQALAARCGLGKYYFMKLFKRATGYSPQQYYALLVIDKSKQLLENTDYSVSEIARRCGVEDSLYFSRLFKKHTGLSPMQYRQRQTE